MRRFHLVALGFAVAACAQRTDNEVRTAWAASVREPVAPDASVRQPEDPEPGDGRRRREEAVGWERISLTLARAVQVLSRSPGPERFELIAKRWCESVPEPKPTEYGDVRVCFPNPPLSADGYSFSLELGNVGMIGLVAQDLPETSSRQLVAAAKAATVESCIGGFAQVVRLEGTTARRDELYTCAVAGGSTLVVGRVPTPGTATWQVSIAVLGAH